MADGLLRVPWKYAPSALNAKLPRRDTRGPWPLRQLWSTRTSLTATSAGQAWVR